MKIKIQFLNNIWELNFFMFVSMFYLNNSNFKIYS